MRKERNVICLECRDEFTTRERNKFCSLHCSTTYNNRLRIPSEEQKQKVSEKMKLCWVEKRKHLSPDEHSKTVGAYTKGKYKGEITSILDVSSRTASKILKRLGIGCCICGWKEASCDIHHIDGKKIPNANNHQNLTCVCPNHHRMFHNGKLDKSQFVPLDKYFPDNWKDLYYG
jgi:predicted restriction endonuclease